MGKPEHYAGAAGPTRRQEIAQYEAGGVKPPYTMDLHVLRLGDVAIATNPFELCLDYGMHIQARSRAEQTILVQLANSSGVGGAACRSSDTLVLTDRT